MNYSAKKFSDEIVSVLHSAVVKKCKDSDKKPGRSWCVYKDTEDGKIMKNQPKGFPKTYKTEEDAKEGIKLMKTFGK